MKMKKNLFMVAAVALVAAVSCNKEGLGDNSQTPSSIVFTAGIDTKTVLVPDTDGDATVNHQIHWVSGDEIRVDGVTFKTTDSGAKANFTTESAFTADNDYYAIYPASAGTTLGFVTVPAAQEVEAGKFNPSAVVSVAKSTTTSLEFKNVTSLLKFQVPAPATTVTISSSSPLAGDVSVDYNEGEPTWTAVNTVNTITVTGSFETGKDYYVAVLPGAKTNFEVRIDGYYSKYAASVTLERSVVMNMKILPAPEICKYGIVGGHQGWSIVEADLTKLYKVNRNETLYAVKDIQLKNNGFKFFKVGATSWDIAGNYDPGKDTNSYGVHTKSNGVDYYKYDTENGGKWYEYWTNSGDIGNKKENIGVSNFNLKYDIYLYFEDKMSEPNPYQHFKFTIVKAGDKMPS